MLLRADAGRWVGYGHVMRCLTLGAELASRQWNVVLMACKLDHFLTRRASNLGITVVELTEGADDEEFSLIKRLRPQVIVLDGYNFAAEYVAVVRTLTPSLVMIDDNGSDRCSHANLVVNQNLHAAESMYPGVDPKQLLLGPPYALVRAEVTRLRCRPPEPTNPRQVVLVALGGTDVLELAPQVATALSEHGCDVRLAGPQQVVGVTAAPADIAQTLAHASVAVIGGGSTMLEASCLGTAVIVLVVADNQVCGAEAMRQVGFAEVIDCRRSFAVGEVTRAVMTLLDDPDQRSARRRIGSDLVDGLGVVRVGDALERLVAT